MFFKMLTTNVFKLNFKQVVFELFNLVYSKDNRFLIIDLKDNGCGNLNIIVILILIYQYL